MMFPIFAQYFNDVRSNLSHWERQTISICSSMYLLYVDGLPKVTSFRTGKTQVPQLLPNPCLPLASYFYPTHACLWYLLLLVLSCLCCLRPRMRRRPFVAVARCEFRLYFLSKPDSLGVWQSHHCLSWLLSSNHSLGEHAQFRRKPKPAVCERRPVMGCDKTTIQQLHAKQTWRRSMGRHKDMDDFQG